MAQTASRHVLTEAIWPAEGAGLWARRAVLVALGVAIHIAAAKIAVPVWPSPVPITMGSFAVLMLGAAYGPRLGLATILVYMGLGAFGWDVFAGTSAELNGIEYMMGGTGGYLVGWVLATLALGLAARRGWDRSIGGMAAAMAIGTVLVYVPGILWLGVLYGWDKPILEWGLYPFLIGDALKLALAALIMPALWKLVGNARA
ncbi:MAG: biotin transporter BioY [Rhodobacteraceae bacterium]|uniref:biotin transporter BioY n=1 Tax=Amaricoccus sp. TaxID=1872485 RepID=UPI001DFC3BF6|nr:biotin transporter BioY [Amaricoccus sp.]MCB1374475.1 biotin transporter BioY [Paracoccaceae bacterium]MCB1404477.1 biotin transporter BioY [Paracoccaceae bacterium]HRW14632.1 biotin transporter BioY [Amaricoccus sp.]